MTTFSTGSLAAAAYFVAAGTLDALREKGLLSHEEALAVLHTAANKADRATDPDIRGARAVIEHFHREYPDSNS